jgi:Ser/Thr protein kinase RdoA (MazF antagonist)
MQLFQPDNFSQSEIRYKEIETPDFILQLLPFYFAELKILKIFQLDRSEISSENYKIILKSDNEEKAILLRKHKLLKESSQIELYLGLICELEKLGVRVSHIIPTLKGEHALKFEGGFYTAFEFIGANYFLTEKDALAEVARVIAKMHIAFDSLDGGIVSKISAESKKAEVYYNIITNCSKDDYLEIKNLISRKESLDEIDEYVLGTMPKIMEIMDEVEKNRESIMQQPKKVIHSDLHPHNILMQDGKVKAIIDFDQVRISEQGRDIAMAIYRFGRQFFINEPGKASREAGSIKDLFISEYIKIRPLSADEIRLLPLLIKDEFLIKLLFVLRWVYLENKMTWAKDLPKFIVSFKEIEHFWK